MSKPPRIPALEAAVLAATNDYIKSTASAQKLANEYDTALADEMERAIAWENAEIEKRDAAVAAGGDPNAPWPADPGADTFFTTTANLFGAMRALRDAMKKEGSVVENVLDRMSHKDLPRLMHELRVKNVRTNYGTIYLTPFIGVSIIDKPAAFEWLRANQLGDLIQEQVSVRTLAAYVGQLEAGDHEPPAELFKISKSLTAAFKKG